MAKRRRTVKRKREVTATTTSRNKDATAKSQIIKSETGSVIKEVSEVSVLYTPTFFSTIYSSVFVLLRNC